MKRTSTGIIINNTASQSEHDYQRHQYSIRSSFGMPMERFPRRIRRQDLSEEDDDDGHKSLLQSKSESKLRCLTTKRKYNINLRTTKSETLQLSKTSVHSNDTMTLDYVIKSFESIEVHDDYDRNQYGRSLKLLCETDLNDSNKSYVFIDDLKKFKESCLLYNVTYIK